MYIPQCKKNKIFNPPLLLFVSICSHRAEPPSLLFPLRWPAHALYPAQINTRANINLYHPMWLNISLSWSTWYKVKRSRSKPTAGFTCAIKKFRGQQVKVNHVPNLPILLLPTFRTYIVPAFPRHKLEAEDSFTRS
jgi:hypothetical protein